MESDKSFLHHNTISLWIIDDHQNFRETVQEVINNTSGMECPQIFASCEETIEAALHLPLPDIVLMDVNFPHQMSGIVGVRHLRARAPDIRVVMFSMHQSDDIIFEALRAGAEGFL